MRKLAFCISKKQRRTCTDQRLCLGYTDSAIFLLLISEISSLLPISFGRTARFVSCLVGNPEDRFTRDAAHFKFNSPSFQIIMPLSSLGLTSSQGYGVFEAFTGKNMGTLRPSDNLNVTVDPSGVYIGIATYI